MPGAFDTVPMLIVNNENTRSIRNRVNNPKMDELEKL
jgi:hypothetical protein